MIKLKRTDTTLDLSQKAKRAKEKRKREKRVREEGGGGGFYTFCQERGTEDCTTTGDWRCGVSHGVSHGEESRESHGGSWAGLCDCVLSLAAVAWSCLELPRAAQSCLRV